MQTPKTSLIPLALAAALLLAALPARAADEPNLERLATCQDSWLDWKDNPALRNKFAEGIRAGYNPKEGTAFFKPKSPKTVLGLPVTEVAPDSIGMAVGFSVVVSADFDTVKRGIETQVGKTLKNCDSAEGMKTCELELAPKKTIMLLAEGKGTAKSTLMGCAYYYEK